MKKLVVGFIAGFILATASAVYADEGLQKVEAYLRPSLPISLNGKTITLDSPPAMIDGSTYLKLRDVSKLTGLVVNWNENNQTVELGTSSSGVTNMTTNSTPSSSIQETKFKDLRAIYVNGTTYFSPADYNMAAKDGEVWGFDSITRSTHIKKKDGTSININVDDLSAVQFFNGETYINIEYYPGD
ncbi:stalk domain-containing protein [Paenibacillus oryzisoli]|uniref:Copper amine oxidase-like N-terminal domain-containing protein n=1 Tax=Paenibacillus oryzisoli TaxID=1850517 RepID=A0A198A8G6_9BACL|nr:stalk domain-containing protein [Paenibacillus oryzisoli]OAS17467.1 hypothetical protein A8708_22135 [Paenibacillus oryzisoli]